MESLRIRRARFDLNKTDVGDYLLSMVRYQRGIYKAFKTLYLPSDQIESEAFQDYREEFDRCGLDVISYEPDPDDDAKELYEDSDLALHWDRFRGPAEECDCHGRLYSSTPAT